MSYKDKGLDMNIENLSEEDLYSDEDEIRDYADNIPDGAKGIGGAPNAQADRRAHHNALERKRRDHIKDSFTSLRDAVPTLKGDKVKASRAQILKKAADYIGNLKQRNESCQSDIEEILKQNKALLEKVKNIETRAQANGIALPPSLKNDLPISPPSTATIVSKPSSQSKSTPAISTLQRTISSSVTGGGTTTSVITGGSGTVKLESNGKATSNGNKIILLNNTRNTVVIPGGNSRLVTNTIKNGVTGTVTTGSTGTSKIIVQNPQHVLKRELSDETGTSGGNEKRRAPFVSSLSGGLTQHVIQLSATGQTSDNLSNAGATGTPIIISSNALSAPSQYVISRNGSTGYRALMVQQSSGGGPSTVNAVTSGSGSGTATTGSLHIVSSYTNNGTIPKVRRLEVGPIDKKMKISNEQNRIIVPNIKANGTQGSNQT